MLCRQGATRAFPKWARALARGPDCLPCAAGSACDLSLAFFSCWGQRVTRGLNDSNLAFLPKGDDAACELTADRDPVDARPFSIKNVDVKAISEAANV